MQIILFEDKDSKNLYPITLTRASFDILCGGTTLYDLVKSYFSDIKVSFVVQDYLQKITNSRHGDYKITQKELLFINSSLVPDINYLRFIERKIKTKKNFVLQSKRKIIAAYGGLAKEDAGSFFEEQKLKRIKCKLELLEHPWQIIDFNQKILAKNLEYLSKGLRKYKKDIYLGENVKVSKNVVFDTEEGPILIGDNTEIGNFIHLEGPIYIGKNCKIRDHASIEGDVSVGDTCKVGGEVEASIIQEYTNKQHYGFLGHSYVGEWVNLGAGTCNSDLKNTYGTIKMQGKDTGKQFLGCIIGDYSKTAINTSILTGKIIGVNSHLYGTVVEDVPSFTNYAKQFGNVCEFLLDSAIATQKRVFERRKIKQKAFHKRLLKDVYEITKEERKERKVKKEKFNFK